MNVKTIAIIIFCAIFCFGGAKAQILVPDDYEPQIPVAISSTQKAVRTSTDIVALALPVATLAGVLIMQDWEGLKEGLFTGVTAAGATYMLKYTVNERRPDRSDSHSFPSGHTTVAFATATFLQRRYGWKVGVPAYALSVYVGWGRCFSKKHHWWDVLAGAAIGTASAWIFTTPFARKHELSIAPVSFLPPSPALVSSPDCPHKSSLFSGLTSSVGFSASLKF
ncbi:MAG: phosphatase PAP2 family protein [Muribaculaceae bacterium]|nr:phosphatase PAP2 family protein [Muribaculaceae bacterium]